MVPPSLNPSNQPKNGGLLQSWEIPSRHMSSLVVSWLSHPWLDGMVLICLDRPPKNVINFSWKSTYCPFIARKMKGCSIDCPFIARKMKGCSDVPLIVHLLLLLVNLSIHFLPVPVGNGATHDKAGVHPGASHCTKMVTKPDWSWMWLKQPSRVGADGSRVAMHLEISWNLVTFLGWPSGYDMLWHSHFAMERSTMLLRTVCKPAISIRAMA